MPLKLMIVLFVLVVREQEKQCLDLSWQSAGRQQE